MSNDGQSRVLWIAAIAAICAWPLGHLAGVVLSVGQDGPGSTLAMSFGSLVSLAIWVISAAIIVWRPGKRLARLSKRARALVVLSIFFLPAAVFVSIASYQDYDLRVWNQSGANIDDVAVRMIGRQYGFGAMSDGASATIGFQKNRPKGSATLSWMSADGESQMADVDLSEMVPARYHNGVLTFTIQSEGKVKGGFFIQEKLDFE